MAKISKVVKVKEVQNVRLQDYFNQAQAILINPKWRVQTEIEPSEEEKKEGDSDSDSEKESDKIQS